MNKQLLVGAIAMTALLVAACGDDDDNGEGAGNTTATTGASSESTAPQGSAGEGGECTLDAPLKIGYAADLGELAAFADQPGSEAAQVMVDKINDAGGVGGLPIEYSVKDIQGDPAATQRAAQELLDSGVNAIIGPPFASTGAPLLDTVDGKVPVISMASTDLSLADPSRGAFLASFSDPVQASAMAQFATEQGYTSAITFSSADDIYFSGNAEFFKEAFEHDGGTVERDFAFSLSDTDFSTQVNEIAAMDTKPEVLFTAMVMPQIQTLLEQLDNADLGDIVVMGADAFDATVVWSAGDVANGVFFAAHTFPQDSNGVQAFLDEAAAAGANIETISFGALAADSVQIIAAAAEQACSTDGATLISTIDGLTDLPVTTGTVTYAGKNGVPEKDVVILTVDNGAPAFVEAMRPEFIAGS